MRSQKIFVAGHHGMMGSAILRKLRATPPQADLLLRDRAALDLAAQAPVVEFFQTERPDVVILAAARVGGIHANNSLPAQFIYENLMIEANVIHQAWAAGVKRLLFLGSSCIYPKQAEQPIAEEALLTGPLEPTNEPYAIAKIAGLSMCQSYNRQYGVDYRAVMPPNLYGPGDNFHPTQSHVLPALIRRFHEAVQTGAEEVVIWGSGTPRREFLHVDDAADAALFALNMDKNDWDTHVPASVCHVNIGTGTDIAIMDLARLIAEVTGFKGRISNDYSKPDGAVRKLMDTRRLAKAGWKPKIGLEEGIVRTYEWFLDHQNTLRTKRIKTGN